MTSRPRTRRRLASIACATSLLLPVGVVGAATPALAVRSGVRLVDHRWGGPGLGSHDPYAATIAATDTTDATASQSVGLVDVTSTLDYGEGTAAGTGMVLRSDGIVVTNHHVVAGATKITVTVVSTGARYTARLLGYDATHDVAVLRLVGASGLTTVDTSAVAVGTGMAVTAVGDANGDGGTLTAAPGSVVEPRTHIAVTNDDGTTSRLTRLIEVTSDVIPGDSGGALIDRAGDVIGMNVAASEGYSSADIEGYVIPIARVLRVVDRVLHHDTSVTLGYSAFLGVELGEGTGLAVQGLVADGPAEAAGIVAGDTITSVAGHAVTTEAQLHRALAALTPGDTVTVTWTTAAGADHSRSVTVVRAPVA